MNFWNPVVFLLVLVGCNTPSIDLGKAAMLEQQGNEIGALNMYLQVIEDNPNSMHAKNALRYVQRIHLKTAKSMEGKDSQRAVVLHKKIIAQWPNSEFAMVAQRRLNELTKQLGEQSIEAAIENVVQQEPSVQSDTLKSNAIVDEAELAACETARSSTSRIVWQQYKQDFPNGACASEADEFLKVVEPRALELNKAKELSNAVIASLRSVCVEYRLAQTTSNENACNNPSRALSNEFARLQRRKADLLKDDNAENKAYYQKFIPPRWEKLSAGKATACGELLQYVSDLEREGVNRESLESALQNVQVCFGDEAL